MIRSGFLFVALTLATVAGAQLPPSESSISGAFALWRTQPDFYVRLDGQQIIKGQPYDVLSELYFSQRTVGGQTLAKVEVQRKFKRPADEVYTLFQRVVGDGVTLYDYRPASYEYSAIDYGTYNGPARTAEEQSSYVRRLLAVTVHAVGDTEALTTRLLREVYGGDQATFHRWLPRVEPQSSAHAVAYDAGTRRYAFLFDQTNTTLTGIEAYEVRPLGTSTIVGNYSIFATNLLPSGDLFRPFAVGLLRGWRIVADSRGTNF